MARIINFTQSFRQVDQFIDQYNETSEYRDQVKLPERTLAKEIIKIYSAMLGRRRNLTELAEMPSLYTNNVQLAGRLRRSPRSVMRYVKRLIACGLLVDKKFHGSNSSYEVWINPELIHLESPAMLHKGQGRPSVRPLQIMPNCPDTESFSSEEKDKNNLIIVQNSVDKESPSTQKPHFHSSDEEKYLKGTSSSSGVMNTPADTFGADLGEHEQVTDNQSTTGVENHAPNTVRNTAPTSVLREKLKQEFWETAMRVLYGSQYLSPNSQVHGRKALDVWYDMVPDGALDGVHRQYMRRLWHARKYVDRDPENRFIPVPQTYFNVNNPKGFTGTKAWDKSWKENKFTTRCQVIYRKTIGSYTRNLKTGKVPQMEMYRRCEQRLGKLKNPGVLQQFWTDILTINRRHA